MASEAFKYKESIEEIESILDKIENNETDIDTLIKEVKRAAQLIRACKEKLQNTEAEIENILKEIE